MSRKKVKIGQDSTISWGTLIMDTDSHDICQNGVKINDDRDIVIGEHVWVGANCTLLKGTMIPDGCIIAAGSLITGKIETKSSIVSGSPIRILKHDVQWKI